ncbi:B-cell linker protein-like [Leptonychotes weddellii]|uniref:B-cell linker protein-like n=1 Tax=Leptonychotes weddellii TaxID=9713 RepID=A0A7F8QB90_LEPWE|nr:B-cell linker protein-like [Leptonychotes weddellii]
MGLGEDSGDIIPPQGKIGDCGEEVSDQNLPNSPHVPRASLVQNHLLLVHEEWKKETLRQLQKMVHDIKNNEGGIMNKIKKLKVKAPPSVPQRDYASENPADEEEQWSDDFALRSQNQAFKLHGACCDQEDRSRCWGPQSERGTRPHLCLQIFPNSINVTTYTCLTERSQRCACISELLGKASLTVTIGPRFRSWGLTCVCVCAGRKSGAWDAKSPSPAAPSPLPRAGCVPEECGNEAPLLCSPPPPPWHASSWTRGSPAENETSSLSSPKFLFKSLSGFPEGGGSTVDGLFSSNPHLSEQEADLHCKQWYAGACDRKSAEEALYRSNKDGSFLIRKSSGHDSKQPYTLVVFFNKRVYNIPVRFIEATKQYALGRKKNGEEYFGSVAEIIKNHQHSPLVLIDSQNNTKDSTRLKYAVKVS